MALPNGISPTTLEQVDTEVCPFCGGKGYLISTDDLGQLWTSKCECSNISWSVARLEHSGLKELVGRYRFDTYMTPEPWQTGAKAMAQKYVAEGDDSWFFIAGTPGSGKTHLATAIVGELIKAGCDTRYMLWRKDAPRLKALINDRDVYEQELARFSTVDVLYIDDFFKGKVTEGDINLAFELLNDRYNTRRRTIISGELDVNELLAIDEAIGSRIYERSRGYYIKTPKQNWRLLHPKGEENARL